MQGFRVKLATMGAGKTEDLIREYHTHKRKIERTDSVIITVKPSKDTRNIEINSRNDLSLPVDIVVSPEDNLKTKLKEIDFKKELIILITWVSLPGIEPR